MKLIIRFALEGKEGTIETTIQNKEGLEARARSLIAAELGLDENQCQFTRLVGKESLGYQNAQNDEVFLNYAVVNLGKQEETESVGLQSSESQESRITTGAWTDGAPLMSVGSEPGTIEASENPKGLYRSKSTPPFFAGRGRSGSPSPTEEESEEQVSKPHPK
ncbi:hypothetical protein DIZ81_08265 [Legionella taurinensis]|uniref:Ubiquitin-like domain-containing protein n=1 Tax=Legionella taurinensis TaxID=70611 RepID=A0AB38N623_9GAMM|nr:hypothetical protein [Legionella taurinensis]MDX1837709.1 hypothetical protein [Legionella taurinensis]PUT39991.1 hypothetical protein DB744_08265 [Legionella taurinensis]PUT43757.1 hypothetical protein DB746_05590 [Legionella taurinensis]PUT46110.1 hypothetical protein DB743_05160 [Legionella taurinensis]PUT47912.1 hypothetical protein DB745_06670 [Legionella taurinensis]